MMQVRSTFMESAFLTEVATICRSLSIFGSIKATFFQSNAAVWQ
jgi:hypothetical protein